MSLEQALAENTSAIRDLISKLGGLAAPTVTVNKTEPATSTTEKPTKTTKADKLPGKPLGPTNEGDEPGTRYFHNTKHDSVYRIAPSDPQVLMPNSVEITGVQYKEKFGKSSAASTEPSADTAQTAAQSSSDVNLFDETPAETPKVVVTSQVLSDKMRELHKAKGNVALLPILEAVGAKTIPTIAEDKRQKAYDLAVAALAA